MEFKIIELETEIKSFGNVSHIILPRMFKGKKVLVKIKEIE